ncbi:proprotein convertase subtilisin/kexin type 6-like [Mercenaria mercenaria]|uniref:proprotein convertase subtilisin/kexin type 6-like n=1 Tax=Mercenaria mercenaria TaxID=6596 RepID=UPI00234F3589|nr:proprotein convertase subtilisin/kexin type 6-like [Mercenaria mercenaria]
MYEFPSHSTASEVSRKLTSELDGIDICMNTWSPTRPFDQLDLASRSAIEYGVNKGRHGRGAIYVVPACPCGSELSSNIHTISVNSIGSFGTNTYEIIQDASVLISGLRPRDGNNHTSSSMVASSNNKCEEILNGEFAAVSQVSGIIALGLQANPALTIRDVQHLLVNASDYERLAETMHFKTNGANRHFHSIFGYGILNADKFVMLAQKYVPVPNLQSWTIKRYKVRTSRFYTQIYEFCYSCQVIRDHSCLIFVEHVTTTINFTTTAGRMKTEIISPSTTRSTLMDLKIKKV